VSAGPLNASTAAANIIDTLAYRRFNLKHFYLDFS
jgi:hypothetical protein